MNYVKIKNIIFKKRYISLTYIMCYGSIHSKAVSEIIVEGDEDNVRIKY